ncbi:MAG: ABC transporter ATP-binding protein [Anaeroplasmataceae bacterium]
MLEIKNFTYSYDESTKAVDDLSITIEAGDIYGFVGHNGAGKSTTIKACVGILDFKDGEILYDGKSIKSHAIECKKELAYIPDNPDLYDGLTGIQYLNFICDIYNVKEDRLQKIEKYADMFGIKGDLSTQIKAYSHGMKQKLAIISALVHNPKFIIMDEPFVGLDPRAAFQVKEIMREIASNGGSIFFSSHVLETVEKLCNKVAIIKNGKLVASGNIDDVKGDESLESLFIELLDKNDETKEEQA